MENLAKLKEQLEYLFLRIIVSKLKNGSMKANDIQPLCKEFLSIEPFSSIEDAHAKINQFAQAHSSFSLLKEYADVYYDEERLDEKLEVMRTHLKNNNIEDALKVIDK